MGAPWGLWSSARVVAWVAANVAPWVFLSVLTAGGHASRGWLALGAAMTAPLPLGIACSSVFWHGLYPTPTLHDVARFTPLFAALVLAHAERPVTRQPESWRWRLMYVGLGAGMPWLPLYLHVALDGFVWAEYPWWHAPQAALAVAPLMVGAIALARGKTWGIVPAVVAVVMTFIVEVPPPEYSCFGPQGHPFGYGWARTLVVGSAVLAVAPWIGPLVRSSAPSASLARNAAGA
ncbi:MAG: hypothetical protein AB7S26_41815 [Sandaracinaceae bacterium]